MIFYPIAAARTLRGESVRGLVATMLCMGMAGCSELDSTADAGAIAHTPADPSSNKPLRSLRLRTGLLSANDVFSATAATLHTCESSEGSNGQFALQVAADVIGAVDFSPELLRIHFHSDTSEWVGSVAGENDVYPTQQQCEATGRFCEEVVVGEGQSGYFAIDGGYTAMQNIWCRYFGGSSYSYTVRAKAMDMAPWPYEDFSEEAELRVDCIPMPCCPPNDYIFRWGNHTVEPWSCSSANER